MFPSESRDHKELSHLVHTTALWERFEPISINKLGYAL